MEVICKQIPLTETQQQAQTSSEEKKSIICAYCSQHIAWPENQISINHRSCHVFANPHGYVFEIVCFSEASGCLAASQKSDEFSWFMGYAWQIGVCRSCQTHLGWIFSSDTKGFYGIILEKIIFP